MLEFLRRLLGGKPSAVTVTRVHLTDGSTDQLTINPHKVRKVEDNPDWAGTTALTLDGGEIVLVRGTRAEVENLLNGRA